jgi:hypothetical protein
MNRLPGGGLRRSALSRAMAMIPALVLLCGLVLVALHNHDPKQSRDGCAVCTAAGATATETNTAPAIDAPRPTREHAPAIPIAAPRATTLRTTPSRAPPQA